MVSNRALIAPTRNATLSFELGLKSDPILYRYSFDWLFRLLADEGVQHVQLGTFFELYDLPNSYFSDLRRRALDNGVSITSVFTAHRELGGFLRDDGPGWVDVARRNFERLIDIAGLLGAKSVGSNPGAVLRDRLGTKHDGIAVYFSHFKQLMARAGDLGIEWLTIEPMSCVAEPPTLPEEIDATRQQLVEFHAERPGGARPGYCVDVAHGYADAKGEVICDHLELIRAALPMTCEVHLKNTDSVYDKTFGFTQADRDRGAIDITAVRDLYANHAEHLPVKTLIGYLEVSGPKLGRDYADLQLGPQLRESLQYLRQTWTGDTQRGRTGQITRAAISPDVYSQVKLAPSLMCADLLNLERHIEQLVAADAADLLHLDLIDGRFAPNLTLGLTLIEQLRPKTNIPLDVHLMVKEPEALIPELIRLGVDRVAVHSEAATHLDRLLNQLRDAGVQAGVAINPATPLSVLDYVIDLLDFVLVMTVNPGYAGQKLCSNAIRKIADCRRMIAGRSVRIAVDGNVSFTNIPNMVAAGADELVTGSSSIFSKDETLRENAARIRNSIRDGLSRRTDTHAQGLQVSSQSAHP